MKDEDINLLLHPGDYFIKIKNVHKLNHSTVSNVSSIKHKIILYDGDCNLCNTLMTFVIRRDNKQQFQWIALQSTQGQTLLKKLNLPLTDFETIVLVIEKKYLLRSTAILTVMKLLGGAWKILYVFIILPAPIRDYAYHIIAHLRYRIFGKRHTCMIPHPKRHKS